MIDKSVHHPHPSRTAEGTAEDLEHVGLIAARTLARLEERYRHELMDEVERLELRDRIVRIKWKAGRS